MNHGGNDLPERVLVLAPFGRDAAVLGSVLSDAGYRSWMCSSIEELCAEIQRGALAVLIAQEALSPDGCRRLNATLTAEPAWSDVPVLIMTSPLRSETDGWEISRAIARTAHLTLLERPFRMATLLSAVRAAANSRRKQYQVRDELLARRRTEQKLARQQNLLQQIIDSVPVMLVIWDGELQRFTLNRHAEQVLGWTTADANDGDFLAKVYPDPHYRAEVTRYMQSLAPGWREIQVTTKDGAVVPSDWANIRLEDDTRIGIGLDLRERKRAEAQLRESEWRLRRLIEGNIIGVVTANPERILEANDAFLQIIGASREELESLCIDWQSITPPEHRAKDEEGLRQLVAQGSCEPFEKEYFRRDGTRVPVLLGATLLHRDPLNWMCFVLDLTELKKAERALRELNETLEAQVAERAAVAERRARDLRRLAAELSEAEHRERTRLARLLHDDLQQLLLAAQLRLPIVRDGSPEQREEQATKVDELLKACQQTSRNLSHELSPPILQRGTLPDVLKWLGEWFHEQHELAVSVAVQGDVAAVPGHILVFIFQAVRELLTNVIKHSGSRQAGVTLASRGDFVVVQVEDGGSAFDLRAARERLQHPEGFGLFSIRERLEALGGKMEIDKTAHNGACLRLLVPATQPAVSAADSLSSPQDDMATPRRPEAPESRLRLLIVDDHAVVREGLVGLLQCQPDFLVVGEAANGQQAVQQADALQPDAILMDVDMPTLDGIEATRRIKPRHPHALIIGLSLHEDEAVRRAMTDAGADDYISKHAPAKEVLQAIRRACGRSR